MKRAVIFILMILVLITLAIPAFADETISLDSKIEIDTQNTIDANNGRVEFSSWPWLPLLQFERYRSLFEM